MPQQHHVHATATKLSGDWDGALLGVSSSAGDTHLVLDLTSLSRACKAQITLVCSDGQLITVSPNGGNPKDLTISNATVTDPRSHIIGEPLPDGSIVGPVSPSSLKSFNYVSPAKSIQEPCTYYQAERHAAQLREEGYKNARLPDIHEWAVTRCHIIDAGRNDYTQFSQTYDPATADTRNWTSTTKKAANGIDERAYVYSSHPTAPFHKRRDVADKGTKTALAHFIFDADVPTL